MVSGYHNVPVPSHAMSCNANLLETTHTRLAVAVAVGVLYPFTHELMPPWVAAVAMAASR
mgnify:CR=1 FL=1|jgi:hypothetical protein